MSSAKLEAFCGGKGLNQAVDTTAAGDTFTGFFMAAIADGIDVKTALEQATKAAAISVSRKGAAPSIPTREEMLAF